MCSTSIIWLVLAKPHHLFVWRVRIFFKGNSHPFCNLCPVGMHKPGQRCTDLIDVTANTLSVGVVALMLMAVQRDNLELSVKQAVRW